VQTGLENAPVLWVAPALPPAFRAALALPAGIVMAERPEGSALRLEVGSQNPSSRWVYALVAPFPTIEDSVASKTLQRCWQGEPAGPFGGRPLLVDESTLATFTWLWGEPAAGER
jgi:poly-gamma-glutamate synthesis protein (capsule biosynthesis protein)